MPRLTVGLITYNGASHIRASIDSILGQTFADLELLIFDNGSTDGTSDICAEYAERTDRVTHVRHPRTIPQSANFRGVLMASNSELFMWATDDDVRAPEFIEACVKLLDAHPNAVAACTQAQFQNNDGSLVPARGTFAIVGTPDVRVRTYFLNPRDSCRLFGVYRTEKLKRAYPEDITIFGYDWLIVGLTMLHGDHLEAPGFLLTRAANPPGKYFARYDRHFIRGDGFGGWASTFLPLLPLSRSIRAYLPVDVWRAARLPLLRLNLHQTALLLRWRFPQLELAFRALRRIDRALGFS